MLNIETNFVPDNEIRDVIRLFHIDGNINVIHKYIIIDNLVKNIVNVNDKEYKYEIQLDKRLSASKQKKLIKRACKHSVYLALRDFTGLCIPWGSLTGIRPTKLAYEYLSDGGLIEAVSDYLVKSYDVLPKKAKIVQNIVLCQAEYRPDFEKFVNFYVHIPFCTSKCSYCSFTTHITDRCTKLIPEYINKLVVEIKDSLDMISASGKEIYSIYIGGGTPTALPDECLEKLLSQFKSYDVEFTCEAGRPDTITDLKLEIMKKYGVNRICVNPQSLNDDTLKAIGRKHTVVDFYRAYNKAKKFGFDINVDLIAGLNRESLDVFMNSLNGIINLKPENITIHTLSVKNGSELKNSGGTTVNCDIEAMVDAAQNILPYSGYMPYYLYRQKNMLGNLENVGYCLNGKQCGNNITTMEEMLSVVACGAGAISKKVSSGDLIERLANVRDAFLYVEQFEDRLEKKIKFFEK